LKATAGVLSTALVDLASNVTGNRVATSPLIQVYPRGPRGPSLATKAWSRLGRPVR
jgi:hypothetical protein